MSNIIPQYTTTNDQTCRYGLVFLIEANHKIQPNIQSIASRYGATSVQGVKFHTDTSPPMVSGTLCRNYGAFKRVGVLKHDYEYYRDNSENLDLNNYKFKK